MPLTRTVLLTKWLLETFALRKYRHGVHLMVSLEIVIKEDYI